MDDSFEYWYAYSKTMDTEDYDHHKLNVRRLHGGGLNQMALWIDGEFAKDYTGHIKSTLIGTIYTINNGLVHCDQAPSFYTNRYVSFFEDGVVHRKNGPATIFKSGEFEWALYGDFFDDFEDYIANNTYIDDDEKLLLVMKYG